jgi:diguanylate cyclase (GGDEF)-like protein
MLLAFTGWTGLLPIPVALAAVATIGYLMGRRRGSAALVAAEVQGRQDLKRAQQVARELERIAESVRQHLAAHHASVVHFKDCVFAHGDEQREMSGIDLRREAENIIKPTLKLAAELASAYDEIRQQTGQLMAFGESRTDPLTHVSNRRALEEHLESNFALLNRYRVPFAIAILDIDQFKRINEERGRAYGDSLLESVARVLADTVRDTDIVTRYGGEEFVVLMPHTMLDGASSFANRLRQRVEDSLPMTLSAGVTAAVDGDHSDAILARAEAALYAAKAAGRNQVFEHNGRQISSYQDAPVSVDPTDWTESPAHHTDERQRPHELLASR